jgi:hypothetical protein
MKESKWWKEIPLIVVMVCPFLVYLYLKPLLPDLVPSHYTMDSNGNWVVNGRMSPAGLVVVMFFGCLVTYGAMGLTSLVTKGQERRQGQFGLLAPVLFSLKAGLVLFFSAIPLYEMLVAAGKLTAGSATLWAYLGGIGLLVLLNLLIYRIYTVAYRSGEGTPLGHTSYVIVWVSTHVVVSIGPLCVLLAGHGASEKMVPQFILVFLAICGNLLYNVRPNTYLAFVPPGP